MIQVARRSRRFCVTIPTPVSNLAPAIPADPASIVARCLRKDRARRYQNMADVKVALEDVRDALRSVPREQTSHYGRRWRLAGALLLGCAVIAHPVTSHGGMQLLMGRRRVRCR